MTDKQLEYIVTIANEKSITKAANILYVSQSSLSQILSHVEQELKTQLFDRTTIPLTTTYEGDLFLQYAKQVLEGKRNLIAKYQEIKNKYAGRIHIGMSQSRSWLFAPQIIPSFTRQYPDVEILFTEDQQQELHALLLQGKIDIIFETQFQVNPEVIYHPLFKEKMFLTIAQDHPICTTEQFGPPIPWKLLESVPFILNRNGHHLRAVADRILAEAGIHPRIILESHSMDVCYQMSYYGLGISIIPDSLYYFYKSSKPVHIIPLGQQYSRTIGIAYRKDMHIPFIVKEFIRIAADNLIAARQDIQAIEK